ncbi:MAG: DUF3108 domain-containing protein [Desulfuromonadales bacterium]|nr:DUF3108 domain-containing protein [Desulfuromonadales bacterium]
MRLNRLLLALTAILSLPLYSSSAAAPVTTVTHYKVSTKGLSIGDVTSTQRISDAGGNNRIQFETRTAVKASFLWMGYQLSSTEKGLLQNGALVAYSHKGQENDTMVDVEGRLENAAFRFDVREQGVTRSIVIPRGSYDYTTMECPEARLDFSLTPRITLRVLDVEKMAVVKRNYQLVRNAHYTVAGKEYPCRIVDFSDQNKKARRWISWDGTTVVMYRQDGKGDKSTYSVQATSLARGL